MMTVSAKSNYAYEEGFCLHCSVCKSGLRANKNPKPGFLRGGILLDDTCHPGQTRCALAASITEYSNLEFTGMVLFAMFKGQFCNGMPPSNGPTAMAWITLEM